MKHVWIVEVSEDGFIWRAYGKSNWATRKVARENARYARIVSDYKFARVVKYIPSR